MKPSRYNRFTENTFLLYLSFLAILTLIFREEITDWQTIFLSEVLAAVILVAVVRLQQARPQSGGLIFLRNWFLLPYILYGYRVQNFLINCRRNPGFLPDRDSWLIAADRFLFGTDPTVWLQKITYPWLTELLQWIYATDYFLPLLLLIFISHVRQIHQMVNNLVPAQVCFQFSSPGRIGIESFQPCDVFTALGCDIIQMCLNIIIVCSSLGRRLTPYSL
jgi:hypothetical protein